MYHHCKPSLYWESANASSLQLFFMESHSASWGCSKYITSPGSLTHKENTKHLFTPANFILFYTAVGEYGAFLVMTLFRLWHYWKFIQKHCQTHLQVIITGGLVACSCVADAEFGGAGVLVVEFVSAGVCPSTW